LNSTHQGNFSIAERGEKWNSSCIITDETPIRKFVSATLDSNKYELDFLSGGIVGSHQETMVIFFNRQKITQYAIGQKESRFDTIQVAQKN